MFKLLIFVVVSLFIFGGGWSSFNISSTSESVDIKFDKEQSIKSLMSGVTKVSNIINNANNNNQSNQSNNFSTNEIINVSSSGNSISDSDIEKNIVQSVSNVIKKISVEK
jgi:hypothetical protein